VNERRNSIMKVPKHKPVTKKFDYDPAKAKNALT
jgi:hypothetical protein